MTRFRSEKHLERVRNLSCLICESPPRSDPHHLTHAEKTGLGLKVGDHLTVPLCRKCHTRLHSSGTSEELFWSLEGIDAIQKANEIYDAQSNSKKSL